MIVSNIVYKMVFKIVTSLDLRRIVSGTRVSREVSKLVV